MDLWESICTQCTAVTHVVFMKLSCVWVWMWSLLWKCNYTKPLAHELAHLFVYPYVCMLLYLPGWPQMRGKGWFWVALGSPSLLVWLKTERTELFNSVPVHTLGLTVALTGTHSCYWADRAREKRNRQRNSVTSKQKWKWGRERKQGLPLWTYNMIAWHKHTDIWPAVLNS